MGNGYVANRENMPASTKDRYTTTIVVECVNTIYCTIKLTFLICMKIVERLILSY